MKKSLVVLAILGVVALAFCQERVDVGKEKEAIKALFEAEKAAYFKQDYVAMGETWVKQPSSMKIYLSEAGMTKIEGWENVFAGDRKAAEDNSWDRKQVTVTFSNYQIDVMNDSSWVVCDTDWSGIMKGQALKLKQSRIAVLKKIHGEWKFALLAIYQIPEPPAPKH